MERLNWGRGAPPRHLLDIGVPPQILERWSRGEEEAGASKSLHATTSSTTAGRDGKQIFPSILRRLWPFLQGRFSEKRSSPNNVMGLRCSFDESHRQPIFLLGGIPALAELIQVTLPYILKQPNLPEKMVSGVVGWLGNAHIGLCIGSRPIKGQR